jgi:hypothetical protein
MVFKLIHPLSDDLNRNLRVSEPSAYGNNWNEMKQPIDMNWTGHEKLFKDSAKIKTYQGYGLLKQSSKFSIISVKFIKIDIYKKTIKYMYSLHYLKENLTVWERDPARRLHISDPDECKFNSFMFRLSK